MQVIHAVNGEKAIVSDVKLERGYMSFTDILALITQLSYSQGHYGRLLYSIKELEQDDPDQYDQLAQEWESHKFKDEVDFILYLEG